VYFKTEIIVLRLRMIHIPTRRHWIWGYM